MMVSWKCYLNILKTMLYLVFYCQMYWMVTFWNISVADLGCFPISQISDSDFSPTWISDPGCNIYKRGDRKKPSCRFFVPINLTKIKKLYFSNKTEKNWANWPKNWSFLTSKIVTKLSEIFGSGKNLFWFPDPDSEIKKVLGPEFGSATLWNISSNMQENALY
jgi:hypothetical protein